MITFDQNFQCLFGLFELQSAVPHFCCQRLQVVSFCFNAGLPYGLLSTANHSHNFFLAEHASTPDAHFFCRSFRISGYFCRRSIVNQGCRSIYDFKNNILHNIYTYFLTNYLLAIEKSKTQDQNRATKNNSQMSLLP